MERLDIKSSGLAWWGMIFLWNVFQRLNFRLIFLLDTKANDMWQISHVKNWGNGVPYRVTKYLSGSYVFPLVIFWYSWKLIIPSICDKFEPNQLFEYYHRCLPGFSRAYPPNN